MIRREGGRKMCLSVYEYLVEGTVLRKQDNECQQGKVCKFMI